jgi:hypothetical protein
VEGDGDSPGVVIISLPEDHGEQYTRVAADSKINRAGWISKHKTHQPESARIESSR